MPKCDLSIELDEPQKVYAGGSTITGVVRVRADADVTCKGLEVSAGWKTHGRGNVDAGTVHTETLFSGEWVAGELTEYRFELTVADWPPTYHGHYLNVDHYIDVRAKIPWAFDPKASAPFLMRPSCGPEGAVKQTSATEITGALGCVIAAVIVAAFLGIGGVVAVATFPFGLIIVLVIGSIGFGLWLFKVFLPKFVLGDVHHFLAEETITPGQSVQGEIAIRPRKNVNINGITVRFEAREQCVSGSGSNRTTHKHVVFEKSETLQEATTLSAGTDHRFPLLFTLPENAPYSLDLDDNDLIWSASLRVDIPRWPDWKKDLPFTVAPPIEGVTVVEPPIDSTPVVADAFQGADRSRDDAVVPVTAPVSTADPAAPAGGDLTFAETVQHLWDHREDRDQVEVLAEAVTGLTFDVEAFVERRLLYSGEEDPHLYPNGYAVWAHYGQPPLPMVLYVPHELADEFENVGRDQWKGRGTIVGWDSRHGRLQIKLERPTG